MGLFMIALTSVLENALISTLIIAQASVSGLELMVLSAGKAGTHQTQTWTSTPCKTQRLSI